MQYTIAIISYIVLLQAFPLQAVALGFHLHSKLAGEYLATVIAQLNQKPNHREHTWVIFRTPLLYMSLLCQELHQVTSPDARRMSCKLATDAEALQREIHFLGC